MAAAGGELDRLARELGLHRRTVERYRIAGMPGRKGREPFSKWAARVEAWRASSRRKSGPKLPPEQEAAASEARSWDGKLKQIRYMREALDLQRQRGEVHSREECEATTVRRVMEVRNALMAIPRKLARRLVNVTAQEAEEILQHELRSVCEAFARGSRGKGAK